MRKFAAGVVLAVLLTLFVALVSRTGERTEPASETTTMFLVPECPCDGECLHAHVACNYEPQDAEAGGIVLKLPCMHAVSPRSGNEWNSQVTNSGLRFGRVFKWPHYKAGTIHAASEATGVKVGVLSVGVLS